MAERLACRALQARRLTLDLRATRATVTVQRTRILRDMHGGVGSHISTAIRQLQSGRASDGEVLRRLRDSLDQLKLSIDAMNVPPGDINALLANIRYRLEPRFLACDIQLLWDVDLLEPIASLAASAMAQLQFMLVRGLLQRVAARACQHLARECAPARRAGHGCPAAGDRQPAPVRPGPARAKRPVVDARAGARHRRHAAVAQRTGAHRGGNHDRVTSDRATASGPAAPRNTAAAGSALRPWTRDGTPAGRCASP